MPISKIKAGAADLANLEISGTEASRMPVGTTAQRASAQSGDIRFNSTLSLMEYYDGTIWKAIDSPPTISSISPTTETDANANINITGSFFSTGATVKFIGNDGTEYTSPSVTFSNSTTLIATTPATPLTVANEPYDIKVTNPSGLFGILADALDAGSSPTWSTTAGSLGTFISGSSISLTLAATDPDGQSVTYSVTTGSLPSGLSLNSSTGAITGTPTVTSDTTTSFTVTASDGANDTPRAFSITVETNYFGDGSDGSLST